MTAHGKRFRKGGVIRASDLNAIDRRAGSVGDRPEGMPGTGLPIGDRSPIVAIAVRVIGRAVSTESVLESHGYTVTDGASDWEIDWTQLIVKVQPDLIGPMATIPQLFVPAEIAGEGRALTEPWRAWGMLYRGPSPAGDGSAAAGLELFGLAPHRGC